MRSSLCFEKFNMFLSNIKRLNDHAQTRDETLALFYDASQWTVTYNASGAFDLGRPWLLAHFSSASRPASCRRWSFSEATSEKAVWPNGEVAGRVS